MKTNERILKLVEVKELKGKKLIDYSQGITERLLEKYKPTKGLSVIDSGSKDIAKRLAA